MKKIILFLLLINISFSSLGSDIDKKILSIKDFRLGDNEEKRLYEINGKPVITRDASFWGFNGVSFFDSHLDNEEYIVGGLTNPVLNKFLYFRDCFKSIVAVDPITREHKATIDLSDYHRPPVAMGEYLYVPNGDKISVIDISSNQVISEIATGKHPWATVILKNYLYVSNHFNHNISVIDITSNEVVDTINTGMLPLKPSVLDENHLYVYCFGEKIISIIDTRLNKVTKTIELEDWIREPLVGDHYIYVPYHYKKFIVVHDKESLEKIKTIELTAQFEKMIFVGNYLFVLHEDSISVIDLKSHSLVTSISTIKKANDFLVINQYLYVVGKDPEGSNIQMFDLSNFLSVSQ